MYDKDQIETKSCGAFQVGHGRKMKSFNFILRKWEIPLKDFSPFGVAIDQN